MDSFLHGAAIEDYVMAAMLVSVIVLAAAELIRPARRGRVADQDRRIAINIGLACINIGLVSILPLSSAVAALAASERQWGLFNQVAVPMWGMFLCVLMAKSLLQYGLHRMFHQISWLWPLHAVHHRDHAIDLSTSLRAHPGSTIIVSGAQALLTLALGPAVVVVMLADLLLFTANLWTHANVHLSDRASRRLEPWLVTPRMHLVHHARDRDLHDSNYGEIFSMWDHVFGTYRVPPSDEFAIGVTRLPSA